MQQVPIGGGRRGIRNRRRGVQPGREDPGRRDVCRRPRRRSTSRPEPCAIAFRRKPPSTRSRSTPAAASSSPRSTARTCVSSSCPGTRSTLEPKGRKVPTPGRDRAEFPQISRPLSTVRDGVRPGRQRARDDTLQRANPALGPRPHHVSTLRRSVGRRSRSARMAASLPSSRTATSTIEGSVSFLNLRSGDVRTGSGGHHGPYKTQYEAVGVTFTPDGRSVVTVGNDSRLLIWDVDDRVRANDPGRDRRYPAPWPGALAGRRHRVYDRSEPRRHRLGSFGQSAASIDRSPPGRGTPGWPWFAMSPDGKLLAVASSPQGLGARHDRADRYRGPPRRPSHQPPANALAQGMAFSPDSADPRGERPVTTSTEVRLWDVASGRMTATSCASARARAPRSRSSSARTGACWSAAAVPCIGDWSTSGDRRRRTQPADRFRTPGHRRGI